MLSFNSLAPHLKTLRLVGFYQIDPNQPKINRHLHRSFMTFVICLNILYTTQEMIHIYQVRDNAEKIMDTMFLMLTYSDCIYKQLVLWIKQDKIEELLNVLKGPLLNHHDPKHRMLLQDQAKHSKLLLRTFNMAALFTCLLWVLYPMILYAQHKPVEFSIWLPFNPNLCPHKPLSSIKLLLVALLPVAKLQRYETFINSSSNVSIIQYEEIREEVIIEILNKFYFASQLYLEECTHILTSVYFCFNKVFFIALGYMWVQTSLLAVGNTSMDVFISFFFAHCKTQLTILRHDLENIVQKCKTEVKDTSTSFAEVFHRRFRNILLHYNEIVLLCNNTQSIFGGAILYFFLISAWILCTSAYRMISIEPISVEFSSMIMYINCILIELLLYCYYGNEVAYESEKLIESAFAMDWNEVPPNLRYPVIIFMERIKRPLVPMAGIVIPLSNNTFVSILRSSYTFYAFLKNSE